MSWGCACAAARCGSRCPERRSSQPRAARARREAANAAGAWGCCGRCLSGGACRARTEGRRDRGDKSERSLESPRLLMFLTQS